MIQPHTLTLDDVSFDKSTGSIEVYEGKYKHIIIPDNFEGVPVTEIDDYAYSEVEDRDISKYPLYSVVIPDSIENIGEGAFQRNNLSHVVLPDSVSRINDYAFADNALECVHIPDSVLEIGEEAFSNNALTSLTIPQTVTYLGENAFLNNPLTSDKPIYGFDYREYGTEIDFADL